jgi:glc operon protein GlcG
MRQKPCLTAVDAQRIMDACKQEAAKNGRQVSIAIVDDTGYLLQFERLDGAGPMSCAVAMGKARTSSLWRRETKYWEERAEEKPTYRCLPDLLPVEGGVPIVCGGECIGGIGVSGAKSEEDARIAKAGADLLT